jgi:hypothetical protein
MLARIALQVLLPLALWVETIKPVGVIDSDVSLPITTTVANYNEYSNYTFRFNLTTKLPAGGYVTVIFPLQFDSGLGIPFLPNCTVPCSRIDRSVSYFFTEDLFPGLIYNMTVYNVKNPNLIGGVGQFYMRTYLGVNLLDESLMMGILGFGGDIGTLTSTTVAVDSGSSTAAGDVSKYIFSFRSDVNLPQNIYLRLQLPRNTFEISTYPSCSSFPINGVQINGTFTCSYNSIQQAIEVRGIAQPISAGSDVGVIVSFKNPKYSFTTNTFDLYVMKEGTTMAFTRRLGIKGVPITAGSITQVSMIPLDQLYVPSKSKLMWFQLNFKLRNPLTTGSIIQINIPNSITLASIAAVEGVPTAYYVQSGLNDISGDNPLQISATGNVIRIQNFQSMDVPSLISINMLLTTPGSSGPSSPFTIASYTDSTAKSEIDKDVSQAFITVSDISMHLDDPSRNIGEQCYFFCHSGKWNIDYQPCLHIHSTGDTWSRWNYQSASRPKAHCFRSHE